MRRPVDFEPAARVLLREIPFHRRLGRNNQDRRRNMVLTIRMSDFPEKQLDGRIPLDMDVGCLYYETKSFWVFLQRREYEPSLIESIRNVSCFPDASR